MIYDIIYLNLLDTMRKQIATADWNENIIRDKKEKRTHTYRTDIKKLYNTLLLSKLKK